MINPSNITEGGIDYSLGSFDGKKVVYDFAKILVYLNAKGKLLFGNDFKIHREDKLTLRKLCTYYVKDKDGCKKYNIDPNKGLLISGPVGCGKTSLVRLMRHLVPYQRWYEVISCRNVVFGFQHIGYKTIEDYGSSGSFCFDDLGVEPIGRFYGNNCNVLGEIILSRYDLFLQSKGRLKTHATTNLNAEELEELYGERVRSRMRQLFNLITFEKDSKDKRK